MLVFLKRLGFFLIGLTLGIGLLNFFFSKKNVEFDYLPNARTLKSIRNKPHLVFSPEIIDYMSMNHIDSTHVMSLLYYGDVNFEKSELKNEPCKTYLIEPTKNSAHFSILVERCDSIATIKLIIKQKLN